MKLGKFTILYRVGTSVKYWRFLSKLLVGALILFLSLEYVMKEIPLTSGKVALVDDCYYEWLNQWKWYATKNSRHNWYARNDYNFEGSKKKVNYMHRLIAAKHFYVEDSAKLWHVDHKDGNGLNNQSYNLRLCSRMYNQANMNISSKNTTGYKGVSKLKNGKYRAYISHDGKQISLGIFETSRDAALSYNAAAKYIWNDFARLNVI